MTALQTQSHEIGVTPQMASILALEDELSYLPQVDVPVRHYFTNGLYAREMFIPQGVALTGAVHKTEHLCVISQGTISVMTEDGVKTLSAPCTFVSRPGIKRVGYAHTDTTFTTFHATTETDLDKLVEELSYAKADEIIGGKNNKQAAINRLQNKAPIFELVK